MPVSLPPLVLPSTAAIVDDASVGHVRVRDITGGLVKLPFLEGMLTSATVSAGGACQLTADFSNSDGCGMSLLCHLTANQLPSANVAFNLASIHFLAHGTAFGLRLLPGLNSGAITASIPFTCLIDDVPYTVDPTATFSLNNAAISPAGLYDKENAIILATDLSDQWHDIELRFVNTDLTATLTPFWTVYGYLAARASGYNEYPRLGGCYTPVAVPTSVAAPPQQSGTAALRFRSIRKLRYYNSTGNAVNVTINWASTLVEILPIPANSSVDWSFNGEAGWLFVQGNFTHLASASGVVCTPFGGF